MEKKFAIFDMDGTLVDSGAVWARLAKEYLAGLGVNLSSQLIEDTSHLTMPETASYFVQVLNLPLPPEKIASDINSRMEQRYRTDIPLKPGAFSLLERLYAAGFKMCVASSTSPALIDACLRRLGVRDCFQFLLSSEEVGVGKSKPDVYLEAARRLGSKPENTFVFEDLLFAVKTAKSAGFPVVAVYDRESAGDREALEALADRYITRWDDPALPQWLGL